MKGLCPECQTFHPSYDVCKPPPRPRCEGCGNEIDPDVCHCGDPMEGHSTLSGHSGIPMGCDCGRDFNDAKLEEELWNL